MFALYAEMNYWLVKKNRVSWRTHLNYHAIMCFTNFAYVAGALLAKNKHAHIVKRK